MNALTIKDSLHWVGVKDPHLRTFDIIMNTPYGSTYNAYLLKGHEKIALIDTVKADFFNTYLSNIEAITPISQIDYLIVNHTEPDHTGAIEKLLHIAPHIKIVGSTTAIKFMKNMISKPFEAILVNTGDTLDLGDLSLQFISTPYLHWPDSMCTYCPQYKALFSCDIFGAHYCFDGLLYSDLVSFDNYETARKYYHEAIMKPFNEHLRTALDKLSPLQLDFICPGHGPILNQDLDKQFEIQYQFASIAPKSQQKEVLIAYVSSYGYTKQLAEHMAQGFRTTANINVTLVDLTTVEDAILVEYIEKSEGILLGSPTINADAPHPVWHFMSLISPIAHRNKLAAAFGSYGWSGESIAHINERFKQLRLNVFGSFRAQFKPSESELMDAFQFGINFADQLLGDVPLVVTPPLPKRQFDIPSDGTVHRWRCVICGEIFEGTVPPSVCPGCAASVEQFEIDDEIPAKISAVSAATIVIIGNGAAGTAACEAIRKRSEDASIILISNEDELGYYRPMLSDYISDSHNADRFYLHPQQWFSEHYIDLKLNTNITKIDPKLKALTTEQGDIIYYDKLIIATGSHCVLPPITDIHSKGVFTLRTKSDAEAILSFAQSAKKLVVIGGGILGLEIAWEVKNIGLDVTVLEMLNRLLPKHLDSQASDLLYTSAKATGIEIMTSSHVSAILQKEGSVIGVQLMDGSIVDCDMIIVSSGVKPNTGLLANTALKLNRGILVDNHMSTSIPDIYAAGDVVEFNGVVSGLWSVATEQGKIAGANAIGDLITYDAISHVTVFNGMNTSIFSIGDIHHCERSHFDAICEADPMKGTYIKLYFDLTQAFVGGILVGDTKASLALLRGHKKRLPKSEVLSAVFSVK